MTRQAQSAEGFSLDGCRTKADVDARREMLKHVAAHSRRAHGFTDDDMHAMRKNRLRTTLESDVRV